MLALLGIVLAFIIGEMLVLFIMGMVGSREEHAAERAEIERHAEEQSFVNAVHFKELEEKGYTEFHYPE